MKTNVWVYSDSNELYHHGVLGMKWGIRRFQNKDSSLTKQGKENKHKIREATAQYWDDKAKKSDKQIAELRKKKSAEKNVYKKEYIQEKIDKAQKEKDRSSKNAEDKRNGKLTDVEKVALIGAAVVAAYATYKYADSGGFNRLAIKGKELLENKQFNFNKKPELADLNLSADDIQSKIVSKINPNYGETGTKMNCRRCTLAYEMSRRGYDVKATKTTMGTGQTLAGLYNSTHKDHTNTLSIMANTFNENSKEGRFIDKDLHLIKKNPAQSYSEAIFSQIATNNPNHARGELQVSWDVGGGHSIAWEMIDRQPVLFDCQSGKSYKSPSEFDALGKRVAQAQFMRLDNAQLNQDFLLRWLQNAK